MPAQLSYPGVYVEEVPSGVHTITGVPTSIAAFVGRTASGPENEATTVTSYADFERTFGGLDVDSPVSFAVRDFFQNGGSQAVIVRLFHRSMSDAQTQAVKDAVKAVAAAVAGETDATKVVATAQAAAKAFDTKSQAEKDAAAAMVTAVKDAAGVAGAKIADIKAAAGLAAGKATPPSAVAELTIGSAVTLQAADPGSWGRYLRGRIDFDAAALKAAKWEATPWKMFTLTLRDSSPGGQVETYQNLSTESTSPRRIDKVLKGQSALAIWNGWDENSAGKVNPALADAFTKFTAVATAQADFANDPTKLADLGKARNTLATASSDPVTAAEVGVDVANKNLQAALADPTADADAARKAVDAANATLIATQNARAAAATDGGNVTYGDFVPVDGQLNKHGIYALDDADIFNLLCLPSFTTSSTDTDLLAAAAAYCDQRRAMLIVDPPPSAEPNHPPSDVTWKDANAAKASFTSTTGGFPIIRSKNAALYFPRVEYGNPLKDMQVEEFPPCGVVAGLYAKTDTNRGVWKAPAGIETTLGGVQSLAVSLTDAENGLLNPLGINCLRSFPAAGRVIWGARTLRGADQLADEYKYVPVRRLALFIEESLYRGTQWAVFEPNDEPLWAQLRLNVGAFMHDLFRQGAFQGQTPQQAYLVKCDKETTTQNDINLGIVNVLVGFAPLKPAEFVVLKIQQLAGQIDV